MREIISRMDDGDDGDHDKCVPVDPCKVMPGQSCIPAICMLTPDSMQSTVIQRVLRMCYPAGFYTNTQLLNP